MIIKSLRLVNRLCTVFILLQGLRSGSPHTTTLHILKMPKSGDLWGKLHPTSYKIRTPAKSVHAVSDQNRISPTSRPLLGNKRPLCFNIDELLDSEKKSQRENVCEQFRGRGEVFWVRRSGGFIINISLTWFFDKREKRNGKKWRLTTSATFFWNLRDYYFSKREFSLSNTHTPHCAPWAARIFHLSFSRQPRARPNITLRVRFLKKKWKTFFRV